MNFEILDQKAKNLAMSKPEERNDAAAEIMALAAAEGVFPASIKQVYAALGRGALPPMTVPAINLRGMTYDLARAIWQVIMKLQAYPVIFELTPSEMTASDQTAAEYAAMIAAAACREGFRGPVFIQGDHFHIDNADSVDEIKQLCQETITAGYYHLDIDAATLINAAGETPRAIQRPNAEISAALTSFIRAKQPDDIHITIGAEVGEIGSNNTTPADLIGFMEVYNAALPPGMLGIDKISVQTGTRHGGIVDADGSLAEMPLDLKAAKALSRLANTKFGIAGLVQHGASTLTIQQLSQLPESGIIEVHLATNIQNIVFDHPAFPKDLLAEIKQQLIPTSMGAEGDKLDEDRNQTIYQQFYNARWTAWGTFKRQLWEMPDQNKREITAALQSWIQDIFTALKIKGQLPLIQSYYKQQER